MLFVAIVNKSKKISQKRKVNAITKINCAASRITNQVSDDEVKALKSGLWICETNDEFSATGENLVCICRPVQFLGGRGSGNVYWMLKSILCAEREDECNEVDKLRQKRVAIKTRINREDICQWILKQLYSGKITIKQVWDWQYTPIAVDWTKAKAMVYNMDICDGEAVHSEVCFKDLESGEYEVLRIFPNILTLAREAKMLPEYLQMERVEDKISVTVQLDKVAKVEPSSDARGNCCLFSLQNSGVLHAKVTPFAEYPEKKFDLKVSETSPNFSEALKEVGITRFEGQYVPKEFPEWELSALSLNGSYLGQFCEVREPNNCTVSVWFDNGMYGRYPLVYLMKTYPAKCSNAKFSLKNGSEDCVIISKK